MTFPVVLEPHPEGVRRKLETRIHSPLSSYQRRRRHAEPTEDGCYSVMFQLPCLVRGGRSVPNKVDPRVGVRRLPPLGHAHTFRTPAKS